MELNIISQTKKQLLGLNEIKFSVIADEATSQRGMVQRELCKKLNLNPDSTVIVNMKQSFGAKLVMCIAHAYSDKESMLASEPKHLMARIAKKAGAASKEDAANKSADSEAAQGKTE